MKEIRAIVRPQRLPQLREILRQIPNFPGLTFTKAEGFTAPAHTQKRTVKEELTDYTPKIMVTVIADEETALTDVAFLRRRYKGGRIRFLTFGICVSVGGELW